MAAAMAADKGGGGLLVSVRLAPPITRTRQGGLQLLFQHRLDEAAHASANAILDGVRPIIEKQIVGGDSRRLHGILRHGVVSLPALQRWNRLG